MPPDRHLHSFDKGDKQMEGPYNGKSEINQIRGPHNEHHLFWACCGGPLAGTKAEFYLEDCVQAMAIKKEDLS